MFNLVIITSKLWRKKGTDNMEFGVMIETPASVQRKMSRSYTSNLFKSFQLQQSGK